MEVHHHPKTETKSFKEYILEGLMIFLAVTLGFFAESLREHLSDRSKEKEYMAGLVQDIRKDTAELSMIIKYDSIKNKGIDSLLSLSNNLKDSNSYKELFYYDIFYLNNMALFKGTDAVMQQLKSSGNLRLIQKLNIADSIESYDAAVKDTYGQGDIYKNLFNDIENMQFTLFYLTRLSDSTKMTKAAFLKMKDPMITKDRKLLETFINKAYGLKSVNQFYHSVLLKKQLTFATRMIALLKQEYNIKE